MELILNEKKYAEQILETGQIGRKPSAAVKLLVRYYYHEQGLRKKKILVEIDNFMSQNYDGWNYDEWIDTISKYIGTAKKYPLLKLEYIPISSLEMEKILSVNNEQAEKLLFTSVCVAKYYFEIIHLNLGWVNLQPSKLFKLANQSGSKKDKMLRIHFLKNLGMVTPSVRCDNTNVHVNIIDNSDEMYKIYHMADLGNEQMVLSGKGFYCEKCGKYEKQNKRRTKKYCRACASPAPTRMIVCEDCGKVFEVSSKNSQTTRCCECYADHRKMRKLETQRLRRSQNEVRPSED